ncbi:MAG: carbohydrate ABC transporter permease [Chloroflexi bacterium CFX4]|nr:carbohydrate ABC transporter permease [Chloroflexi bacterium CFX4]MDL1922575.1 carbohydrate ABC transporter permease [Chloroflexi bacterium CFX3]
MTTTTQPSSAALFVSEAAETARRKRGKRFQQIIFFSVMLLFTLIWLIPMFSALYTSIRVQGDLTRNGFWSLPSEITLSNFGTAWERGMVGTYLGNSFIITIPSLIGMLFLSSLAAYALARYKFKGNMLLYFMFVAGTMLPFQILLLPVFYLTTRLGLYNQFGGLILIHTAFQLGFCTFVLRNFMRTVPGEILEAARIDGAGEFRLYWRIMMPLSLPALAALATLEFTWIFNDYLWAIVLISSANKKPVTAGVAALKGQFNTDWPVLVAGALVATLPTVFVFTFLQRYFIQGLTLGSGK